MKKRVLYLSPSSGKGGAETFLLQTAALHKDYVPVYACLREGPLPAELRSLGAEVHVAPFPPRLSRPLGSVRVVRWLASVIKSTGSELVHSTLAYGALYGGPAAWLAGVPHLWFQHGPVSGWQDWLAGRIKGELILVNSDYTHQRQQRLGGQGKIKKVRLGVLQDPAVTEISREQARENVAAEFTRRGFTPPAFTATMICRPQPQKGIHLWLRSLRLLRQRGVAAGGILIGGLENGSRFERSIAQEARELELPFLHLTVEGNPWALARGCDALVCASVAPEGFGLTIAEALAYGIPAVAPREGGPMDMIHHGENGLFFTPRDPVSLCDSLFLLAQDAEKGRILVENGCRFARDSLAAEATVAQLELAYAELIGAS